MPPHKQNPFYRTPDHPNFNRRAYHHDYTRPSRYLITIIKNPILPPFSVISGNPYSKGAEGITVSLTATGAVIPDSISRWQQKYPVIVEKYAVMPDHLHICLNVAASLPNGLSRAVANLMGMISKTYWLATPEHSRPAELTPMFSRGFNDRIAYTTEQWNNQIRYTVDNPRRYLVKKKFPGYLLHRWTLNMPDGRKFVLRGNIFLLRQPQLFRVKTSRSFSEARAAEAMAEWQRALFNGAIPVSPFIHPHEKALRDFAIGNGFAYIRICTNGFGEREAPAGAEFELISEGRVLLIGQPELSTQKENLKYSFAQTLNQLALEIAGTCNAGLPLSIRQLKQ